MSDDSIPRLNAALEGRYRVERALGEGGMATVYVAEDLRHDRAVALKVLKPELGALVGSERFLAEIRVTARLQHPNILPLFDSGEADGLLFYVMPLVEGESLRDRLEREKQLPVDEAVKIVTEVADALDHAHRKGVVHRDIKPANILLSGGRPLVADFGIALAVSAAGGGSRLTETGLSVGTPYYMSPEQATGDQHVGPASDTYSLACVLYEMLVGEPPYPGSTAQAVLAKIIRGQPASATEARKSVPDNVDSAIRKALEKLPADRFTNAADFAGALGDASFRYGGEATAAAAGRSRWTTVAHVVLTLALAGVAAWALFRPEPVSTPMKFRMDLGALPSARYASMAMPPDGSFLTHVSASSDSAPAEAMISIQRFDGLPSTPIPGTEGGYSPSISTDGTEMAFVSFLDGSLKVVSVAGGVPRTLADSVWCCARWEPDGFIYYVRATYDMGRVLADGGGTPEVVAPMGSSIAAFPRLSRSGKTLFVLARFGGGARSKIEAVRLADGTRSVIVDGAFSPPYHAPTGHIIYVDAQGRLVATRFNERELAVEGAPIPLAEGLPTSLWTNVAISEAGNIAYVAGTDQTGGVEPVWVDRAGQVEPIDPEWGFGFMSPSGSRGISLSPDGSRVAVSVFTPGADGDIYVKELPRGAFSRLTASPDEETRPRWTPEGEAVTYVASDGGPFRGYRIPADLASTEGTPITDRGVFELEMAVGNEWIAARGFGETMDVWAQHLDGGGERYELPTPYAERAIAVSPDGRWLAYESDETGQVEVYVRSFPDVTRNKRQVSPSGGREPRWGRTGKELFYIDLERRMVSVEVDLDDGLALGDETVLFEVPSDLLTAEAGEFYALYDVDVDDQRFLMLRSSRETMEPEVVVMLNAFELLKGN